MCEVCGCGNGVELTATNLQTGQSVLMTGSSPGVHEHVHVRPDGTSYVHAHSHEHERKVVPAQGTGRGHHHRDHGPAGSHGSGSLVEIETRVLAKNDALAARNRAWLAERDILALNLMSAPGAGKTTLLERTIRDAAARRPLFVLEGDQATSNDGERIRAAGAPVVQINTGAGCHLDADMVSQGLQSLNPGTGSIVVIENVGNLVCPALFDVGEHFRIVILSVTEGDDKPLKYPHMFRTADLILLNKIDLLPHVDFDVARAKANAQSINPEVTLMSVSARTGEGLDAWYDWLAREPAEQSASL
jgi:hydrogenase nickel incorporation protein HypB